MDFYVPTIGDKIYLTEDWTFTLYQEHRNTKLAEKAGLTNGEYYYFLNNDNPRTFSDNFTLPAKTCLIIDRIYIKKGAPGYDSITFRLSGCPDTRFNKGRFWVKLRDANRIKFQLEPMDDKNAPAAIQSRFANL